MRVFAIVVCVSAMALAARAEPQGVLPAADWSNCIAKPTKACVFDRASINARSYADPQARAGALAQLAKAEIEASQINAGLRDAALRHAQELYDLALTIDHAEQQQESLCVVVAVRARAGDFVGARQVMNALKRDYWIGEAVRAIATEMTKAGKTAEGVAFLRADASTKDSVNDIRRFAWDVRNLVVERGEEAPVIAVLQHAQELADAEDNSFRFYTGVHHPSEFVPPLMIIATALANAAKTDAALKVALEMKNPSSRATVLAAVGRVIAYAGNTDRALTLARDVRDADERVEVLVGLFVSVGWEGNELIGARGSVAGDPARRAFDASMKIASAFATPRERDHAYALLADINANGGNLSEALRAASLIRDPHVQFNVFLTVGRAQAKAGARPDSAVSFAKAKQAALQDAFPADQLSTLAQAQADAGQSAEALATVEAMRGKKSSIDQVSNGQPIDNNRAFAMYAIAKALAREGRTAEAFKLARETQWDGGQIMNGVGVVAEGLADADRIDESLEASKAQTNSGWRDNLLLAIIKDHVHRLNDVRRFDHANRLRRGIARDFENAQALLAIARAILVQASLYGEEPENPGIRNADGLAAVSEALTLTTAMKPPNLALDILVEAGGVLSD